MKWRTKGGIFLIGYTAFRNLSMGNYTKDANVAKEISHAIQVISHYSPTKSIFMVSSLFVMRIKKRENLKIVRFS